MDSEVAVKPFDYFSRTTSGGARVMPERQPISSGEEELLKEKRAARVEQLRAEYQRGTFQVDASALSSNIITKHLKK